MKQKAKIQDTTSNQDNGSKPRAIIIDLDGTLSNSVKRVKFVSDDPKDYESFYKFIPEDKPNEWCKDLVEQYWVNSKKTIIFLTGRPEWTRTMSIEWLREHLAIMLRPEDNTLLFMRADGDYRKDDIIKEEHVKNIKKKYDVLFAIDDRMNNCEMFERNGIKALFCGVKK